MALSKNKIKYIQSLKDKKQRSENNTFVAEGNKMVTELLAVLRCQLLIATKEYLDKTDTSLLLADEIIEVSDADILKASFLKTPQQVLAVFYKPEYRVDYTDIEKKLTLVLDGIQDPGNLGTIVRLADWYGIENIICSENTVDIHNPKTVQATMGAIARVKVHYVNLVGFLSRLHNIPIYGTLLDGENIYDKVLSNNGIVVMGNEGNGISSEIEKLLTCKLYIPNFPPQRETSESLNVAVATAIICAEFRRRLA